MDVLLKNNNNENRYKRYYLNPGYVYVAEEPTIITTILGSCMSVCLYDTIKKYGGMNHYLLPKSIDNKESTTKYGNIAIYSLFKILIEYGSSKESIVSYIVGGAYIEDSENSKYIAEENVKIAKKILNKLNINILFEDTGGVNGRKVCYNTEENEIEIIPISKNDYNKLGKWNEKNKCFNY